MKTNIQTRIGYVHGLSSDGMMIQVTDEKDEAMTFDSVKAAKDFLDLYSDAGFGLPSEGSRIRHLIPPPSEPSFVPLLETPHDRPPEP